MEQLIDGLHVILQARDAAGGFSCEGFIGVPTVLPALIVLDTAPSEEEHLRELVAVLGRTLVGLTPQARRQDPPCAHAYTNTPFSCHATTVAVCQKVLVLLGSSAGEVPGALVDEWLNRGEGYRVIPVFPAGADLSGLRAAHPGLAEINAAFWTSTIEEVVPTVLSTAAVTSEDFRVFISYKRLDSLPLANQLFRALTEAGFDVFLDRFSIEPAVNFQVRLTQELADKSMVLLLESPHLVESKWTQVEIAFAKKHELGLLSLLMPVPEGVPVRRLADVDEAARIAFHDAESAWRTADDGPGHVLTDEALAKVVLQAKEEHGKAMARRRERLRGSMLGALDLRRVSAWMGPDGLLECEAGGRRYSIWLTPRPPDLPDFHFTHGRLHPAQSGAARKGIVVGPTASLEVARQARTAWLADRCEFRCYDEDQITELADWIEGGAL